MDMIQTVLSLHPITIGFIAYSMSVLYVAGILHAAFLQLDKEDTDKGNPNGWAFHYIGTPLGILICAPIWPLLVGTIGFGAAVGKLVSWRKRVKAAKQNNS